MNAAQVKNALAAAKQLKAARERFQHALREHENMGRRISNATLANLLHGRVPTPKQFNNSERTLARIHRNMVNRATNFAGRYHNFRNQNINNIIRNLSARTIQRHARGASGRRSAARYKALGSVKVNTTTRSPSGSVRRGQNGLNAGVMNIIMRMARRG